MACGRKPLITLNEAKHIAQKHGEFRYFRHEQDMICSFVICIAGLVAHVRIRQLMGKTVTIQTWNTADIEDGSTHVHKAKFQ